MTELLGNYMANTYHIRIVEIPWTSNQREISLISAEEIYN
jgi:hypothetical protein